MKKSYFLFCLFFTVFGKAQVIDFPDANFKAKLLQANVGFDVFSFPMIIDANNNGEIEVSEVQAIHTLDISNGGISDLTGISYFTEVVVLNCSYNSLANLNLNSLLNLKSLNCSGNLLTNLTIDNAISLNYLHAHHNSLISVNVNLDNIVEELDLSYNNLTSFAISGTSFGDTFSISNNQLTSLTLNNCNFYTFYADYNNLTSVQFLGVNHIYRYAGFSHNQFSVLNLNVHFDTECTLYMGNNVVDRLFFNPSYIQPGNIFYSSNNTFVDLGNWRMTTSCNPEAQGNLTISNSPNLQQVILKNGFNHAQVTCNEGGNIFQNPALRLNITNCPNLTFICVDELEKPHIQTRITQLGLQNQVQVNSYCTFTPGGTFYTVSGTTQYDFNANGCDSGDFYVANQKFSITNGTETGTVISDDSGNYNVNVGPGTHTITPILENPALFTVSPSSLTVDFPTLSSPLSQNFCISAVAPTHDFDVTLVPLTPARPGFDAHYTLVFKNTGNVIDAGTVVLAYQDAVLDFVAASTVPDGNSAGVLSWSFTNLIPFETRTVNVTFNLNGPMETPPLNGNDILNYAASIGETGASQPYSNTHSLHQTVVNSFDPNDKICLEGESLSNDFIGDYVSYRIRFENTGTFAAENIVVKDIIDATKFDITTLMPVMASHQFYTRISGNTAEFVFENIHLPFDDAHNDGFIVFKIKLLPGVTEGVAFENQASIYFDYNFPVITNTATSVIGVLGNETFDFDNQFTIYPVPARNSLQLASKDNLEISSVAIYNNLGQIVQKEIGNKQSIDVSHLAAGRYYLKIQSGEQSATKAFLKE